MHEIGFGLYITLVVICTHAPSNQPFFPQPIYIYIGIDTNSQDSGLFRLLCNEIAPYTNAWRAIAINLDISNVDIDRIASENDREQDRLIKVFEKWHTQCKHPFTWDTILKVLEEPMIGERCLAQELHRKYCE